MFYVRSYCFIKVIHSVNLFVVERMIMSFPIIKNPLIIRKPADPTTYRCGIQFVRKGSKCKKALSNNTL